MNEHTDPEFLSKRDMARSLRVTVRTIENWTYRGVLPKPLRIGHVVRWPQSVLQKLQQQAEAK